MSIKVDPLIGPRLADVAFQQPAIELARVLRDRRLGTPPVADVSSHELFGHQGLDLIEVYHHARAERGIDRRVLLAIRCAVPVPVAVHARLPEKIVRECPVQLRDLAPHLFVDELCKPGVPALTVRVRGGGAREVGRTYRVIGTDLGPAASVSVQPPVFGVELVPKGLQSRVRVVDVS